MKLKSIVASSSLVVIIGFITGLAISLRDVTANRYIQYKMFRLTAFTFQKNWNIVIVLFLAVFFTAYISWFLVVKKMKCDKTKTVQFVVMAFLILAALLSIDRLFKGLTDYTLLKAVEAFINEIGKIFKGRISLIYFLNLLKNYVVVIIIIIGMIILLAGVVVTMPRFFSSFTRLLQKLNWKRTPKTIEVGYVRKISGVLVALVLLLNLGLFVEGKLNAQKGPNIVILLVDCLRKDHVGIYGYSRDTTPNMDYFSQEAVVFQDAISQCSWTIPSVASLFSSLYPSVHRAISHADDNKYGADILNYKIATVAELARDKGYATGAFVANRWICKRLQFDQGFNSFNLIRSGFKGRVRAENINERALKWIYKNAGKPFFVYLHYMDCHGPYRPLEPYASLFKSIKNRQMTAEETSSLEYLSVGREKDKNNLNYYIDKYDGAIRYVDHHIGNFLKQLEEYGLSNNTIIIITADHGEAFFEHGVCEHGYSLYNEEINVPLIVKFPESIKIRNNKNRRIQLIDITAAISRILGRGFPYNIDGKHLLNTSNDEMSDKYVVFSEELSELVKGPPKVAMIKDNFKAIYMVAEQKVTELYDLRKDESETKNIIKMYPEKSKAFEKEIKSWQKEKLKDSERLGLEESLVIIEDQKAIERLKSLGYVQ